MSLSLPRLRGNACQALIRPLFDAAASVVGPVGPVAREAARRTQCQNNLKQFGLATQNYVTAKKLFPPSVMLGPNLGAWSAQARLLPFMEDYTLYQGIDFTLSYSAQITIDRRRSWGVSFL